MARKNLDDLLSEFGNPGKCQLIYGMILVFITLQFIINQQFSILMTYIPHHYCKAPPTISYNISYITKDECTVYSYNFHNRSKEIIPCPNGWTYETLRGEIYPSNEFDLVCEREYLFRLALTVPFFGVMLGSLVFGYLSDKYGRKTTIIIALPFLTAVTLACTYSPDLNTFMLIRFLAGFFSQGAQTSSTTYISELFRRRSRTIASYLTVFIAAVCLPVQMYLMYFLLNWRVVVFIEGIFLALSTISSWFLPESVPWLISQNKLEKSKKVLEGFAKFNKLSVPDTLETDLEEQAQEFLHKQSKSSLKNYKILLCHPSLTKITLVITYLILVNNLVISGLSFSISALEGNVYTNYLINGILQIFILAIFLALFNWCGRVKIFSILFGSCGLLCIGGFILIYYSKNWHQAIKLIALFMALVSRNLTTATAGMLLIYASELFPTFLRSTGIGICSTASRIGSTITPQILYSLNHIWEPLPQTFFGVLMLIAGAIIWLLPETFHKFMPSTLQDVDKMMGKSRVDETVSLLKENYT